eukprot:TRINITY_DN8968_c0_g1_i1.p1 TRINITY_DN8968_c0_g1~~TRINITY_DN8968_c0_g1_i1.p1  ORF type:complete len:423 (-),score=142.80 TRINITY_DN8968_c0_g1_i1:25-1293(-)
MQTPKEFSQRLELAKEAPNDNDAIKIYNELILDGNYNASEYVRTKEIAISELGSLYVKHNASDKIKELFEKIRPITVNFPKSKTAKIIRKLLENLAEIPDTLKIQLQLVEETIKWCNEQKNNFLRQRLETRLALLYFQDAQYKNALELLTTLLSEVRKLDDKQLLVEIQLLESRVHHRLRNLSKSRASLTAARTAANTIYLEQDIQAQIDLQAGILHAEEKDYKTAYSYFYEAFEGFSSLKSQELNAVLALKYMLLCKVMTNNAEDIKQIMSGKLALKYNGEEIEAMKSIANAYKSRSLKDFYETKEQYKKYIEGDIVVSVHLTNLYENLLEQNLLRIIEPYSCVDIPFIAKKIDLEISKVEKKLSQMILDEKLKGTIDQNTNTVNIFELPPNDKLFPKAIETVQEMNKVVQSLFDLSSKLN